MSVLTGSVSSSVTLRFKNDATSTLGSQLNWAGDFGRSHQINSAVTGSANQALVLAIPGNYDVSALSGAAVAAGSPMQVADATAYAPDKVYGVLIENLSASAAQTLTLAPGDANPLNLGTIVVQPGGQALVYFPNGVDVGSSTKNIKVTQGAAGTIGRLTLIVHADTD